MFKNPAWTGFAPMAALITAMLLWSSSFVVMKVAVLGMHPMRAMAFRMLAACLALLPFARLIRKQARVYRPGDWLPFALMVLCEPCLYFLFESHALELTYASHAGMIAALLPVMILLAARWRLKERIQARTGFGMGLAVAGAMWLTVAGGASEGYAPRPLLGNFLEFLGMVAAAGSTILVKRLAERYSPLLITAAQTAGGLIFFAPLALLVEETHVASGLSLQAFMAVAYLGIVVSVVAYGLWNYTLSALPAGNASAAINLIPVFSVLMAFLFMGERFSAEQFAAAGLVIIGMLMTRTWRKVY